MMTEFDDMIRNTEWDNLTQAQKDSIAPLAADEQTYRTARQILLSALKETENIPVPDGNIVVKLKTHLPQKQTRRTSHIWRYAAAAVVLLTAGIWWYRTADRTQEPVIYSQTKPVAPGVITINHDTLPPQPEMAVNPAPPAKIEQHHTGHHRGSVVPAVKSPVVAVHTKTHNDDVFLVSADPRLLDLITEVY